MPPKMTEYVKGIWAIGGPNRTRVTKCMGVSYGGTMAMTFTRKIKEAEVERLFFTKLVEMGIPVEIESNQRDEE